MAKLIDKGDAPDFCKSLRTNSALICHVQLFNGEHVCIYSNVFDERIPTHNKTGFEIDVYRKILLNEDLELQTMVMREVNSNG